jgi:cytidylate kinase
MKHDVIAIDGPSASGKSTVSKRVASALGYLHVDSGSVYRGVTWACLAQGVDGYDAGRVAGVVRDCRFESFVRDGAVRFRMNGTALQDELRERSVDEAVSPVSTVPAARQRVVAWLRDMRRFGNLVMEGRDIGTAVFPEASHKFYLDASAEERARRRHAELEKRGEGLDVGQVGSSLRRRDRIDSTRSKDPLRVASDAVRVDTTNMTIEEVVSAILETLGA